MWLEGQDGLTTDGRSLSAPKQTGDVCPVLSNHTTPGWPAEFEALSHAVATDPSLPGNSYGRQIAAPVPVANAEVMVICDLPDEADLLSGKFASGAAGRLLYAMLGACGYNPEYVHISALAHSRPASGAIPPNDASVLAQFVRHQIGVVKPERLLLFGSAVSETLLGKDLMTARTGLPIFNHDGRNMAIVATFHPRILLMRPILKAQAWQDLQGILRKDRS